MNGMLSKRRAPQSRAGARRRAYTLIEVLVVCVILGIAAAMVTPAFSQTHVLRVQAAVRTVVADITQAQSDALAYQRSRAIVFHPGSNLYSIVEVKGNTINEATDTLEARDFSHAEFGDAVITTADFSATPTMVVDEMGSPVTGPGSTTAAPTGYVEIQGSGQTYRISVEAYTGRVTVARTAP